MNNAQICFGANVTRKYLTLSSQDYLYVIYRQILGLELSTKRLKIIVP